MSQVAALWRVALLTGSLVVPLAFSACVNPGGEIVSDENQVSSSLLGDAITKALVLTSNEALGDTGVKVSARFAPETSGSCVIHTNMTGRLVNNQPQILTLVRGPNRNGEYAVASGGFNSPNAQAHIVGVADTRTLLTQGEEWWAFTGKSSYFVAGPGNFTFVIGASGVQLPPPGADTGRSDVRSNSIDMSILCQGAEAVEIGQATELVLFWDQNASGGLGAGAWPSRTSVSMMDVVEREFASPAVSLHMFVQDPQRTVGTIDVATPKETVNWRPAEDGQRVLEVSGGPGHYRVGLSIVTAQPLYGVMAGFTVVDGHVGLHPART